MPLMNPMEIKIARIKAGISQKAFAALIGRSKTQSTSTIMLQQEEVMKLKRIIKSPIFDTVVGSILILLTFVAWLFIAFFI